MDKKKYDKELMTLPGSRWNDIIRAVNSKIPKEEAGIANEVESQLYDSLWKEAEEHVKKWGDWPVFDMVEIESDDPALDIYKDPV